MAHNSSTYLYGGGFFIESSANPTGRNLIVWGNTAPSNSQVHITLGSLSLQYSCVQGGYTGTGNISGDPLFISEAGGNYYLSQTAAGQAQQSPCVDAGDPASSLIAGTTRTDGQADAGIVDMGWHYPAAAAPPAPVEITLTPVSPPLVIPAAGGAFQFDAQLLNQSGQTQTFNAWIRWRYPN
ncbi:MAG: hypothetical protein C4524_03365, partial [Candidatus Zixiibacteriota bacterium]